jgi:hypothetical protein
MVVLQKSKPEPSLILGSERSAIIKDRRARENKKGGGKEKKALREGGEKGGRRPI